MSRSFTQNIISVFGTNVFSILISLFTGIYLARILGPEIKGKFEALLVFPLMIKSFAELGVRQSTMFYLGRERYTYDRIISALIAIFLVTVTLSILLSYFYYMFISVNNFEGILIWFALMTIPLNVFISYCAGLFLGLGMIQDFNRQKWLALLLNFLFLIFSTFLLDQPIIGALLSLVMSNLIIVCLNLKIFYGLFGSFRIRLIDLDVIRSLLGLGIVYGISLFILQLVYNMNIVYLERLGTNTDIGYFSVATQIANQLWQIPAAFSVVIMSSSARSNEDTDIEFKVMRLLRLSLFLGFIGLLLIYVFSPYIVPILFGDQFNPAVAVIRAILPGVYFFLIYKVLSSRLAGIGKPMYSIFVFLPVLLFNGIINIYLIPDYGAIGAAIGSSLTYIIGALIFAKVYSRVMNVKMNEMFLIRKADFILLTDILRHLKFYKIK